jgi:hypothetical protein
MFEYLKKQVWKIAIGYAIKYVAILSLTIILLKLIHNSAMRVSSNVQIYTIHSNCTVMDTYIVNRVCVTEVTISTSNDTHFATSYYGTQWDTLSARTAEEFCLEYPVGSINPCMVASDTMRVLFILQYETALQYARLKMFRYWTALGVTIPIIVVLTIIPIFILIVKLINKSNSPPQQSSDSFLDSTTTYTHDPYMQDSGYIPPDNPYI